VRAYEEKYQTTYQELHETGLPDDASVEMHEDYIIWSHWVDVIEQSKFISRDLSWLKFNDRVLDQAKKDKRKIFEKLKFQAITASNLDEFFMIRVGSLYNYIDYGKERIDYSGLRELPFKKKLFEEIHKNWLT